MFKSKDLKKIQTYTITQSLQIKYNKEKSYLGYYCHWQISCVFADKIVDLA